MFNDEEDFFALNVIPVFFYQQQDGLEVMQLLYKAFEKYDDVVDENQGVLPLYRSLEYVYCFFKCVPTIYKFKRHLVIPIQAIVRDELRLDYVFTVQVYLQLALIEIQYRKYVGCTDAVDKIVHSRYGAVPYCSRIQISVADEDLPTSFFF